MELDRRDEKELMEVDRREEEELMEVDGRDEVEPMEPVVQFVLPASSAVPAVGLWVSRHVKQCYRAKFSKAVCSNAHMRRAKFSRAAHSNAHMRRCHL